MLLDDSAPLAALATHLRQSEEEDLVHIHQLIGPEFVLIENVSAEQLRRHPASQIF